MTGRAEAIIPSEEAEVRAAWELGRIRGLGPVAYKKLVDHFGSSRAVRAAREEDLGGLEIAPDMVNAILACSSTEAEWRRFISRIPSGARLDVFGGQRYPAPLQHMDDPPPLLWSLGEPHRVHAPTVAIVGSRRCTEHGRRRAHRWAYELASRGVVVVSGMAQGIDAAAHQGALDAGGTTWAVMGTGIDRCYPSEHARMAEAIRAQGTIISEWPLGASPEAWHFPLRNRVISALSHAIIVVEADIKSGALGTVDKALRQGKEVFLVPGRPEDDASRGTNHAIAAGHGRLLTDLAPVWEFLDALKVDTRDDAGWEGIRQHVQMGVMQMPRERRAVVRPDSLKGRIGRILKEGPRHPSSLLQDLACSREELDVALFDLELGGRVETLAGHRISWIP